MKQDIKFIYLYNKYINYKKLKVKEQSIRTIKSRFNTHILPFFKNYSINTINVETYLEWQNKIEENGYTHKYNSSLHTAMVNIFNFGIKFYNLKQNIPSLTGNFRNKNDIYTIQSYWNYQEFKDFITIINDILYKTLFETLFFTGLRLGEALALNWNDFNNNYLHITKTISKEYHNGKRIINSPKTKKSIRIVKLDNELIKSLNKLKNMYLKEKEFKNTWFIFGGLYPLSPTTITRKKDKYCELANVKQIRIHDFRHSHASHLISLGVPITVISERLGHKDIAMTLNTYSHMFKDDEDKAIDKLNILKENK